ncbi:hypothetical protein [Arthrobacter sp.]|uniref:hypothetical protein n=1 Tax=Arthrobacter sp. TaxID=1667 RepID=UPI00289DCD72|nr:hypothetical protein [Arthrobacter sp.]
MAGTQAKQPTHSGEGHLVKNLVTFIVFFGLFALSLYSLNWLTLEVVWPMAACLVLGTIAFLVPFMMGRSDTADELAESRARTE